MNILLRNTGDQPIYEQIYTQIKHQILSGTLQPGTPLPSIRALAKDLRISVITTKRAYDELESAGFICTVAGKGSFVVETDMALIRETHLKDMEQHLQQAARLAIACGLSRDELFSALQILMEEE